jgi:hypothetical protein
VVDRVEKKEPEKIAERLLESHAFSDKELDRSPPGFIVELRNGGGQLRVVSLEVRNHFIYRLGRRRTPGRATRFDQITTGPLLVRER